MALRHELWDDAPTRRFHPDPAPALSHVRPVAVSDFWVFAYGSLMWRPGFDYEERLTGRLYGFHRALCIYSHIYRGTPEQPGLVMGLDRGGSCLGVAFRIAAPARQAVHAYLTERELVTAVYHEKFLPVHLADGSSVSALAYVADRTHPQYSGRLERDRLLALVSQGSGAAGSNADYVRSTFCHLRALGLEDRLLSWLDQNLGGAAGLPS